ELRVVDARLVRARALADVPASLREKADCGLFEAALRQAEHDQWLLLRHALVQRRRGARHKLKSKRGFSPNFYVFNILHLLILGMLAADPTDADRQARARRTLRPGQRPPAPALPGAART